MATLGLRLRNGKYRRSLHINCLHPDSDTSPPVAIPLTELAIDAIGSTPVLSGKVSLRPTTASSLRGLRTPITTSVHPVQRLSRTSNAAPSAPILTAGSPFVRTRSAMKKRVRTESHGRRFDLRSRLAYVCRPMDVGFWR
jgi:hypothetical protein